MRGRLALRSGGCCWRSAFLPCSPRLALAFDPRYRDFPFAPLTVRGGAVSAGRVSGAAVRRASRPLARERWPPWCSRCAAVCIVGQRRLRQLAGALVLRGAGRAGAQSGSGAGSRQAEDQQRDSQRRQRHVVEHDAEAAGDERDGAQHERRPHQIEQRRADRDHVRTPMRREQRYRGVAAGAEPRFRSRSRRRCRPRTARSPGGADKARSRSRSARWRQAMRSGAAMDETAAGSWSHHAAIVSATRAVVRRTPSDDRPSRAAARRSAPPPRHWTAGRRPAATRRRRIVQSRAPSRSGAVPPARRRAGSSRCSRAGAGLRPNWRGRGRRRIRSWGRRVRRRTGPAA